MPNNMISILIIAGAMVTIMTNDMINTMAIVEAIMTIMINTMTIQGAICNDGSVASYYADQADYTPGQTIMVYLEVYINVSCIIFVR